MGNFFAELKRRHVYRVGAAYAVIAWVLLQLFNNLTPILETPPWVGRVLLLLLVIGFPIALVLAWTFEATLAGIKRETPAPAAASPPIRHARIDWILVGALVVVIALVSYQQLTSPRADNTPRQESNLIPTASTGGISIAVLPLVNLSGDPGQEFFSDGMTEEINGALAKVANLQVVARTSAFQFKGQNQDVRAVGQALGASHLIEGSVRKVGDRVRISAQLIRADNGLQVWSENYDRNLTDIFAIQEEIARAIAISLSVPLGLPQGSRLIGSRTIDASTYEDYLRARALVRGRSGTSGAQQLLDAIRLLDGVVDRDANYAPAWALLATAHALVPVFDVGWQSGAVDEGGPLIEANLPKAEEAAKRAIELDPQNADGHVASGLVQASRGSWIAASESYSKALTLDRDNPDALHFYSGTLADLGYVKRAVDLRHRLQVVEPFVPIFNAVTSRVLWVAGEFTASEALLGKLPDDSLTSPNIRARMYATQGRYAEAADALLTTRFGRREDIQLASQILRTAPARATQFPKLGGRSFVYLYVGSPEHALDFYVDELEVRFMGGGQIMHLWERAYQPARKTERFKTLMRDAGMLDHWRAKGWPDLCRPTTGDDFACD